MDILIETAKLSGIGPCVWLADVLARLPDHLAPGASTSSCPGSGRSPDLRFSQRDRGYHRMRTRERPTLTRIFEVADPHQG